MTAHQTEMWQSYLEVVKRGLLKHLRNVVLIDTAWFPKAWTNYLSRYLKNSLVHFVILAGI